VLEIAGEHLCASCVESGRKKGTMQQMETRRFRADKLCLSLGILSVLIFCGVFGLVALPTQIVLWALNRKKPVSLVAKWPRLGYVVGMTLSALSIIVFIALIAGVTFFPDQN
jgi:hypothetical protein